MKITSKSEFFKLWKLNVLGNRTNLWDNEIDAFDSGKPEIGFREIGKAGGGAWEKVPRDQVLDTAEYWRSQGRKFVMDDGCPDWCRTLQGEICRTHRGLEGFLDTTGKLPMRPAIAAGHMKSYSYVMVSYLLNKFMDPSSRDDIEMLLEMYPEATIEFSSFSIDVGVMSNRNTLLWEVRNYVWLLCTLTSIGFLSL